MPERDDERYQRERDEEAQTDSSEAAEPTRLIPTIQPDAVDATEMGEDDEPSEAAEPTRLITPIDPEEIEETTVPAEATRRIDVPEEDPEAAEETRLIPPPPPREKATPEEEPQAEQTRPTPRRRSSARSRLTPRPSTPSEWGQAPREPRQRKKPQHPRPTQSTSSPRRRLANQSTPPPPATPPPPPNSGGKKRGVPWSSILLGTTLTIVGLFLVALAVMAAGYVLLAAQLPPAEALREREPDFASSRIFDRNNNLLYEVTDPTAGKRTYVPIEKIDRDLQLATVATEDRNFYVHSGFDPIAIMRAVYYALQEREIVSGASTITQQVARNILLDPEERREQTVSRKIKEIVLAAELTRQYSKDEILEIYLNNNPYGNRAYGVDAAARTYFGTTAGNLTIGQAAFLAGLPQSPTAYDPYHGGREAALKRQKVVLGLMVEDGYITQAEAEEASAAMEAYEFPPLYTDRIPAPHFVFYVQQWVEENLGPEVLYRGSGLRIHTTLEPRYQSIAEEEVAQGIANLQDRNANNGALVALEPSSGHILAMVGSVDFYDEEMGGQVNVTTRCRQPGSAIKPLTYLSAFEKGWTPATTLWDLPVTYTDTAGNVYEPVNYDGEFRGPVSVRTSLANSLNVPAVKALEFVTVDGLLEMAERLNATSIVTPQLECPDYPRDARPLYGLALTLGGGEMKPLELTAAYATFANGGLQMPTTPILWIEDNDGNVLVDHRRPQGEQVISPQNAYLLTNILSDRQARCLTFSCPNALEIQGRPAAAKTGTTNDFRDAWTVGYTPELVAGVWVGNNDNSEMIEVPGSLGAGPIWNAFMTRALAETPVHGFPRPQGIREYEVCDLSGAQPSPYCPERTAEIFSMDNPPPKPERDWFQRVEIDKNTGKRANQFCQTNTTEKVMVVLDGILDPDGRDWMRQWAAQNGYEVAPLEYCTVSAASDKVRILQPQPGEQVYGEVELWGSVELENLERFEVTYGYSDHPEAWGWVAGPFEVPVKEQRLAVWDAQGKEPHFYTLRIVAFTTEGEQFEDRVVVEVVGPTPTPTPTETPTPPPTVTPKVTPTDTATPTSTPSASPTPTATSSPTSTSTPPTPSATPTAPPTTPPPPTEEPTPPSATPTPTPTDEETPPPTETSPTATPTATPTPTSAP